MSKKNKGKKPGKQSSLVSLAVTTLLAAPVAGCGGGTTTADGPTPATTETQPATSSTAAPGSTGTQTATAAASAHGATSAGSTTGTVEPPDAIKNTGARG